MTARKVKMKRRSCGSFKSPFNDQASSQKKTAMSDPDVLRSEIQKLVDRTKTVQKDIDNLKNSGHDVTELKKHMDMMHQYNEIKDVGQMVLGRISELDGVRTRDLYSEYGLDIND
ncbi:DNA repair protein SWI5 homolog isoform X1 [Mizuhopecten yessoensis]|uniref:DNA repair protein SWI5 homolog isoform X1 n=2 Tax=Mizuhopecten yessoensis TaxID=6573 RepID=UPI000B45C3AF|nr:DNA repair protein SWI5 homolog isoform X1 [Mizuhopecten yessoensis]